MTTDTEPGPTFAPFRNPLYLAYWLTALASNFGWLIQVVGTSWLMATIGGSAQMVALIQTALSLPIMLFALVAGALADTFGRRNMVLWSQCYLVVASVALAVFVWMGWVTPWILLGFTFLIGTGKALNNPAWQTLVSEFMPKDQMPQAIALNSIGFNLARSFGPAIGGVIVATVGAFAAFAVGAASNVFMIVTFIRWKASPPRDTLPPEPVAGAMMAGIRYVAMSPHILRVMLRATVFNFAGISILSLMPLIARDVLDSGAQIYGLLLGAFGVGAIGGALAAGRLQRVLALEGRAQLGFGVFAAACAATGFSTHLGLTLAAMALAGASWVMTLSAFNTTVQMSSPRWVVSRCYALYQTAFFGGNAVGALVWGGLATLWGTPASLLVSAGLLVLGMGLGLLMRLDELGTAGLDPHNRWRVPEMQLDLQPRSGPIMTTIEYVIDNADVDAFVAAMEQRRRSRMRDGARNWNLSRDIEHPEMWTERYSTPTWVDTLRFHARRTLADAEMNDRLRALNRDGAPPKVRHHLQRQPGRHGRPVPPIHDHLHH